MRARTLALGLALLASTCGKIEFQNEQWRCGTTGLCPDGMACCSDGYCRWDCANTPPDMAPLPPDLAPPPPDLVPPPDAVLPPDLLPPPPCSRLPAAWEGTSADGKSRVAFCRAAWSIPGTLADQPACGGSPAPDGKGCNISDSCGPGWKPCVFTPPTVPTDVKDCGRANQALGFWATGALVKTSSKLWACDSPPCVVGCWGLIPTTFPMAKCDDNSGWSCIPSDIPGTLVKLSDSTLGGVICCR